MAFLVGTDPGLRKTKTPTVNTFVAGVGFTAGSSTTVALTDSPGTEEHLTIFFDGVGQHRSTYSVSGSTVTFDTAIPTGVAEVEATFAPAVYAQLSSVGTNAVTTTKILDGAVTAAKIATGVISDTSTDVRLAFLMIAENAGDRLSMDDGIADPYKDETDIDTSGSSNQTYDAAGDFYSNPDGEALISTSGLTPVGDMTSGGGLAAAFNGTQHETAANSCRTASDSATGRVGIDWGSGVTKSVSKIIIHGPSSTSIHNASGTHDIFLDLIGHTSDAPASATLLGDADAVSNVVSTTNMEATTTATVSTAFRFHWLDCHSSTSAAQWVISELEFYESLTTANMTIVSNAFTATAVPATGRIHIQVHPVDAITINTDLTAEISRDGGSNWTVATLALVETLADGTLAYEDNSVTISGQPSGTSMKYRIKTLNLKEVRIHGAVLQWST